MNSSPDFTLDKSAEPVKAESPSELFARSEGNPNPVKVDFGRYDVVIDARSPREFADDHIPVAINLPVVDTPQYERVGILYKADRHRAYMLGVADSLRNMADALDRDLVHLAPTARILVYCFRGGKRSRLWTDNLRTIGFRTDVVVGGWKGYRRWVIGQLQTLPGQLSYRLLSGVTGSGKTRLLKALEAVGGQVLDLEGLACHRGSLIGAVPGLPQPPQKLFDSLLLERLRAFDPARPVWIEAESKKIGAVQLPNALFEAMNAAPVSFQVSAPMSERVNVWCEDFSHYVADPVGMVDQLRHLVPLIGKDEYRQWLALAEARESRALFERVMVRHYDPTYRRSATRNRPDATSVPIELTSLDGAALRSIAERLHARSADPTGGRTRE